MDHRKVAAIVAIATLCQPAVSVPTDAKHPLLSRQDASFCDGNGQDWDENLWNDNKMGEFVNNRVSYWAGAGGEFPSEDGIPEHFAEYDGGGNHDKKWNWGPECLNADTVCNIDDNYITDVDDCGVNWRRAFTLWSMRNLLRFLQTYYVRATDAFDTAANGFADISKEFTISDDTKMPPSSWTSIAGAVLSITGAMVPGVGGALSGVASGAFYLSSGLLAAGPPVDPRFDTFADMLSNVQRAKESVQDSIISYVHRLYKDRPEQGDHDGATELSELLRPGLWANQDTGLDPSGEGASDPSMVREMVRSINSAFITEVWNADGWYLVTWKKDLLYQRFGKTSWSAGWWIDPCRMEISGLDDYTLCHKDRNWVFHRVDNNLNPKIPSGPIWPEGGGFNDGALGKAHLSRAEVIDASQARADANPNVWIDRDYQTIQKLIKGLSENADSSGWTALMFNLPICILDNLDLEVEQKACNEWEAKCLSDIINRNCPKHKLNNGEPWPYKWEE